jgi:hypothetical protein
MIVCIHIFHLSTGVESHFHRHETIHFNPTPLQILITLCLSSHRSLHHESNHPHSNTIAHTKARLRSGERAGDGGGGCKYRFASQSGAEHLFASRMRIVMTSLRSQNRPVLDYLVDAYRAARNGQLPSLLPVPGNTP